MTEEYVFHDAVAAWTIKDEGIMIKVSVPVNVKVKVNVPVLITLIIIICS